MNIRLFDWRDLPVLIRYRRHGLFFDNALVLTRGPVLVPAVAMMSYFASATGIFTYLCTGHNHTGGPLMGQVAHNPGSAVGRLSFLAPETALESDGLPALLEYMVTKLGKRGAMHMLAEVDERSEAFEMLRHSGFATYVRQRIWRLRGGSPDPVKERAWRPGRDRDILAVRSLHNVLVPGLVQQVELPPGNHLHGLVYYLDGELLAYAELHYGPRGIFIQPYIHPDAELVGSMLVELLRDLPGRRKRPVYMSIRSYQSWIEHSLEELGADASPNQAVLVKHLAIAKRVSQSFALPALESGHQEMTAPFIKSESKFGRGLQTTHQEAEIFVSKKN
ncbi:MAG TPA: hypothetical protein VI776_08170 [Anaerolineales bacterium]|nr:hypothetical protein [Anaerolineales bacterium]